MRVKRSLNFTLVFVATNDVSSLGNRAQRGPVAPNLEVFILLAVTRGWNVQHEKLILLIGHKVIITYLNILERRLVKMINLFH